MNDTSIIFNYPGFKKIEENIWVIENFVTNEESNEFMLHAESALKDDWYKESSGWYNGKFLSIYDKPIMKTSNIILDRFKNLFKHFDEYSFGSPASIHRILPGQDMFIHADFSELDNLNVNYLLFNAAIYHNYFDGGELFYPELSIEYKPNRGDLVIHPGTTRYRHGVKKVLGNKTRYMSNLWVADSVGIKIKTSGSKE